MKSKVLFVGLAVLLMGTVLAENIDVIYHPFFVKAYPDPAKPGNTVRLEVTIQNMGHMTIQNISTQILPTSPFTGIKTKGFIPRLDPMETATVVYILNVSKSASPGQYTLLHKITYYYGEYNNATESMWYNKVETSRTIGINVENKERVEITRLDYSTQILSGSTGKVYVQIKNTGNVPINDISVKLTSASDYLAPMAPNPKYIDLLNPGEKEEINFTYKASNTATTGTYELDTEVEYNNVKYSMPLVISVMGYPGVEITNVSFANQPEPGKESTMEICFENMGAEIDNFYVTLLPTSPEIGQTLENQVPNQNSKIAVIGSSSKFFESLKSNQRKCVNFTIAVSDDFKEGPATVYLSITGGNFQETSVPIGMYIKGIPKLDISDLDYDQEMLTAGIPFKMAIQLENSGTGKAEEVKAVLGNRTVYLGSIDVDDASTASFRLVMNKPGTHILKVSVYYKDKEGKTYEQTFKVTLFLRKQTTNILPWIALIVIIVGLIGIWYKVKKK